MTGSLDLMMKMRDLQVVRERRMDANMQAADAVGQMAALGYFDTEFTMYGCAYLNPADGKMYYKVSSMAEDIYDFIEKSSQQNIYPGNIMQYTRKCPVLSGMKDMIAQDVKQELAQELKATYPKAFFEAMYQMAEYCTTDTATSMLWEEAESLEGVFEEERLDRFEELVHYVYSCCNLKEASYKALLGWVKAERRNMDDNFVRKDMFEKTLYGLMYEENGTVKYMENAQREYIYEKMYGMEQKGVFVTPLYARTYWYNYEYRLTDAKKDFKADLRNARNKTYQEKIKALRSNTKEISEERFDKFIAEAKEKWGEKTAETLLRYGHRWGVLAEQ